MEGGFYRLKYDPSCFLQLNCFGFKLVYREKMLENGLVFHSLNGKTQATVELGIQVTGVIRAIIGIYITISPSGVLLCLGWIYA